MVINRHTFSPFIKKTVIASVIIIFIFTLMASFIYTHLQTLTSTLTPKRESFTELYFNNFTNLPTKTVIKNSLFPKKNKIVYSFSFTIHNLENKNTIYNYEVDELGVDKAILDKNTVAINNGDSKTITENYTMPLTYPTMQIVVSLPDKNQHIAFWMWEKLK